MSDVSQYSAAGRDQRLDPRLDALVRAYPEPALLLDRSGLVLTANASNLRGVS